MYIIYRDAIGGIRVELEPGCVISFFNGKAYFSAWEVQSDMHCFYHDMAVNVNDIVEIGEIGTEG